LEARLVATAVDGACCLLVHAGDSDVFLYQPADFEDWLASMRVSTRRAPPTLSDALP